MSVPVVSIPIQEPETDAVHCGNVRHIIEGDRKYRDENESFGDHGFSEKEFVGEELEDVEPEEEPDDDAPVDIEFDEYSDYEEE